VETVGKELAEVRRLLDRIVSPFVFVFAFLLISPTLASRKSMCVCVRVRVCAREFHPSCRARLCRFSRIRATDEEDERTVTCNLSRIFHLCSSSSFSMHRFTRCTPRPHSLSFDPPARVIAAGELQPSAITYNLFSPLNTARAARARILRDAVTSCYVRCKFLALVAV